MRTIFILSLCYSQRSVYWLMAAAIMNIPTFLVRLQAGDKAAILMVHSVRHTTTRVH
jgi:hypothetical protein